MDNLDFESFKCYLMSDEGGKNLYSHLTELFMKLMSERTPNAYAELEYLSSILKQAKFTPPVEEEKLDQEPKNISQKESRKQWVDNFTPLFQKNVISKRHRKSENKVQDVLKDMEGIAWTGVGITSEDALRMNLSLLRLSSKYGGAKIRFFGKIWGTEKDYYIAEAQGIEPTEYEKEHEKDYEKNGPNAFTYFVSNNIGDEWIRLSQVTPKQIIAARKLRRYVTGNLDAHVGGHPPFPGKEKDYLRAQLARIASSTVIIPDGIFQANEEDPYIVEKVEDEEAQAPELETLQDLGGWVHLQGKINELGRVSPVKIVNEEGEEEEDPEGPEPIAPLRSISEEEGQWLVRSYPHVGTGINPTMVGIRCLRWPGAYCIAIGGDYVNLYVGYGVKDIKDPYSPEPPLLVLKEAPPIYENADVKKDPHAKEEEEEEEEKEEEEEEKEEEEEEEEGEGDEDE